MRKLIVVAICLLVVMGSALLVSAQDEEHEWACSLTFEATVLAGDSAELSLLGTLGLDVDEDGFATGLMVTEDGSLEVPVSGQINGHAVNLVFDLGDDVYIFGLGTSVEAIGADSCGGSLGGPFVGPGLNDTGSWLAGTALEKILEAE